MSTKKNCYLRQIKIPKALYQRLKTYARGNKKTMTNFYKEMLEWFTSQHNNDIVYQASYKNGQALSMWVEEDILNKVRQLALNAKVSDARIIYTALMLYVKQLPGFY